MQQVPFEIYRHFAGVQNTMASMVSIKYGSFQESYHVKRLSDEMQKRYDDFKKLHSEVMEGAVWSDGERPQDRTLENKEEIDSKLQELLETKVDFKWAPLPIGIIEQMNPTPEQFTIIEHLMDPKDLEM